MSVCATAGSFAFQNNHVCMCSIPFYIAAPTTTVDPSLAEGSLIPIEERNPSEVTHHQGQQVAAPGVDVSSLPLHYCILQCHDGVPAIC